MRTEKQQRSFIEAIREIRKEAREKTTKLYINRLEEIGVEGVVNILKEANLASLLVLMNQLQRGVSEGKDIYGKLWQDEFDDCFAGSHVDLSNLLSYLEIESDEVCYDLDGIALFMDALKLRKGATDFIYNAVSEQFGILDVVRGETIREDEYRVYWQCSPNAEVNEEYYYKLFDIFVANAEEILLGSLKGDFLEVLDEYDFSFKESLKNSISTTDDLEDICLCLSLAARDYDLRGYKENLFTNGFTFISVDKHQDFVEVLDCTGKKFEFEYNDHHDQYKFELVE